MVKALRVTEEVLRDHRRKNRLATYRELEKGVRSAAVLKPSVFEQPLVTVDL